MAGAIDPTFITGSGFNNIVAALTRQPDGKIIAGGIFTSYNGDTACPDYLARINLNGTLDTTFNYGPGKGFGSSVRAVALQPNGQILVGGTFLTYNGDLQCPRCLARINANGTLDTTFNYGPGKGFEHSSTIAQVFSLALQTNGQIIVGGSFTSYNGDTQCPDYLARINPDGTLDTTFNYGPGTGFDSFLQSVAVLTSGKIMAGGTFGSYNGDAQCPRSLARINTDGTLDITFNYGPSKGFDDYVSSIAIQSNGQIVTGGQFNTYNGDLQCPHNLARINADGTLDTTFNYGPSKGFNDVVAIVILQPDGKILAGGFFISYNGDAQCPNDIARINTDGTLDTTFNYGPSKGFNAGVYSLCIQPDGKVIAGGGFTSYDDGVPHSSIRIIRLLAYNNIISTIPQDSENFGIRRFVKVSSLKINSTFKVPISNDPAQEPGSVCVDLTGSSLKIRKPGGAVGSLTIT